MRGGKQPNTLIRGAFGAPFSRSTPGIVNHGKISHVSSVRADNELLRFALAPPFEARFPSVMEIQCHLASHPLGQKMFGGSKLKDDTCALLHMMNKA